MPSGLSNSEKAKVREQAAQGLVGRAELLDAEMRAYHAPGTCTFYGTANSNQMLMEAMGLHVPGTAFVNPGNELRDELTREAVRTVLGIVKARRFTPIGRLVDERAIVNAMAALLATGGSTNHLIHWVAVARSAGITHRLGRFRAAVGRRAAAGARLSERQRGREPVPGRGRPGLRDPRAAGRRADARGRADGARRRHPRVHARAGLLAPAGGGQGVPGLQWHDIGPSRDIDIVRPAADPFSATGGLKLLTGNLGRSVIKVSAVPPDRHLIEAPARIFDAQDELLRAFNAGELERDVVCVVRWQGPQANGMPELHKLTPPLAVLQGRGFRVALVTDGRMSGASGKVPAAIHVSPEAAAGGPLAKTARRRPRAARRGRGHLAGAGARRTNGPRARTPRCPRICKTANGMRRGPRTVLGVPAQCAAGGGGCLHMAVAEAALPLASDERCAGDPGDRAGRRGACRAAGARAGRRRHPHAGGDAAHAGGAGLHRGHRPRGARSRRRRGHGAQRRRRAGRRHGRRALRGEPRLHAMPSGRPAATWACRCCPAWRPAARSWRRRKTATPR